MVNATTVAEKKDEIEMKKFVGIAGTLLTLLVVSALAITSTSATLELVEWSDPKTIGATIVSVTSSWQDLDYTLGEEITMDVEWKVDEGTAEYSSFVFKRATPKARKDPASVKLPIDVAYVPGDTKVTVTFKFTDLHLDARRSVEIGNAHFKLYLMVDENGDGEVDLLAGFGVNVHVEAPINL